MPTPFLQEAAVWRTKQPTWKMCCRLCSQSASEIYVREKNVKCADLTSTGERRTGVVNREPPYHFSPHGAVWWVRRRTETDAHPSSHIIQLLIRCWGCFKSKLLRWKLRQNCRLEINEDWKPPFLELYYQFALKMASIIHYSHVRDGFISSN